MVLTPLTIRQILRTEHQHQNMPHDESAFRNGFAHEMRRQVQKFFILRIVLNCSICSSSYPNCLFIYFHFAAIQTTILTAFVFSGMRQTNPDIFLAVLWPDFALLDGYRVNYESDNSQNRVWIF